MEKQPIKWEFTSAGFCRHEKKIVKGSEFAFIEKCLDCGVELKRSES